VTEPKDLNEDNEATESDSAAETNGAPQGTGTPDQLEGALEAAEATIARKPEVDYLLVADRAEVVNGKLYLMGGSWDRIQPQKFPHRMMLGISLGVRIPFAFTDEQHTVAIEIQHEGQRLIGFEAKLTTGRPPGMAGMDMLVPMAFNIPIAIPEEGTVVLRASVDGREPRRHEIRAILRPGQQQPPVRPA
jgi:hypothetical protein